jgi:VWFA-related protein
MPGRGALRETAISLWIAFGIWGCSAGGPICFAQGADSISSARNALVNNSEKITIYVEVSDKSGKPVSDLEPADFKVYDNKLEERILGFTATDHSHPAAVPPRVQIIIDAMNSGPVMVAQERDGVSAFLGQNAGKLEYATSIWVLENEGLKQIAPPSKDGTALLAPLNGEKIPARVINQSGGVWGDVERSNQAIELIKKMIAPDARTPGRKLVLFISQGWPMLLNFEPNQRNWVFDDIIDISNGLRESNTSLYALAPSDFNVNYFAYDNFLKGVTKISNAQNADLCLQVLSEHSGGLVIAEGNDIKAEINTAVRDAGAYYTLVFERASGHGRTEYHELRVTVDKPQMKVRTTAGYYMKGP